jgi:hypothetical protein
VKIEQGDKRGLIFIYINKILMKNSILIVVMIAIVLMSCKKENIITPSIAQGQVQIVKDTIPYTIAQNYYVKNTVDTIANPKIETQKVFDTYFGMATTMGKNGKPTKIDFTKEYVIAIVLPKSDIMTSIKPISLQKEATIVLNYKIEQGSKQSYTSRPALLLVVDKKYNGRLITKQHY